MKFSTFSFYKKRYFKSAVSFFIVLLLIVPFTLSAFADPINTTIEPLAVINRYCTDSSVSYTIASQKQLRGFSGNTYTLYQLSPYGYAILMDDPCRLMEACFGEGAVPPIDMSDTSDYYYGGPNVYCKRTNEGVLNVFDNTLLSLAQVENISTKEASVHQAKVSSATALANTSAYVLNSTSDLQIYTIEYNYFAYLTQYAANTVGTCSAIAAQILLGYYDSFINNDVVASQYEVDAYTGHGTSNAFSNILLDYIYYNQGEIPGSISYSIAINGINDYLETRNLCMYLEPHIDEATLIQLIMLGHPLYIAMCIDGDEDLGHACVAYEVQFEGSDPVGTAIFTVNMGSDSNSNFQSPPDCHRLIDGDWIVAGAYMKNTNHSFSYARYNISSHKKTCTTCGTIFYESHTPYWNSALNRCTRCGYTNSSGITPVG